MSTNHKFKPGKSYIFNAKLLYENLGRAEDTKMPILEWMHGDNGTWRVKRMSNLDACEKLFITYVDSFSFVSMINKRKAIPIFIYGDKFISLDVSCLSWLTDAK